jgi:hypothetical protein
VLIKNDHLHLPTGESIPNDGSGHGLKSMIDSWLAANGTACPSEPLTPLPSQTVPVPQLSAHPCSTLSFEAVQPATPYAYVMPVADPEDDSNSSIGELYDMYEVFTAERKKMGVQTIKTP